MKGFKTRTPSVSKRHPNILILKVKFSIERCQLAFAGKSFYKVGNGRDRSLHIFYQGEELNHKLIPIQEKKSACACPHVDRDVPSEDNVLAMARI